MFRWSMLHSCFVRGTLKCNEKSFTTRVRVGYISGSMPSLRGKVAIVTGASRGVGKGIAIGLGAAGATVYVTGRTTEEGAAAVPLPGTIHQTAGTVTSRG